jgi:hypothetical protein
MQTLNAGEVGKRIEELNAGWYNEVNKLLKLNPATFLLAQGTLGLGLSDGSGLYRMADVVVPPASVTYFDAGSMRLRSSAYQMLLNALLMEGGETLAKVLGPLYAKWIAFNNERLNAKPMPTDSLEKALLQWSQTTGDPLVEMKIKTYFLAVANTRLQKALNAISAAGATQTFTRSDGTFYKLFVYTVTPEEAQQAITGSSPVSISFDSSTMDKKLTHTTVEGSASGFYEIFSGGASGEFDQLNTMAAFSEWKIEGKIGHNATLPVGPGEWYDSGEVDRAHAARNNYTVWNKDANAGNWETYFNETSGSLARAVSQLVLVSDYSITVTSHAKYTEEQYQKIVAGATFGVWPFFSASAKATNETDHEHGENGTLVTKHTLDPGLIQIWGVTVSELTE